VSRFTGKVAVVTGAAGGIGAATAKRLASEGAAVALVDLAPPQHVVYEIGDLPATGGNARAYACDITDQPAVAAVFDRIATDFGGLHILVNNAGITRDNLFFRLSKTDWDDVIAVNLTGAYHCAQAAQQHMVAH
jgi:3-oxoacyl-[acyl-carrier protein] reductase